MQMAFTVAFKSKVHVFVVMVRLCTALGISDAVFQLSPAKPLGCKRAVCELKHSGDVSQSFGWVHLVSVAEFLRPEGGLIH